MNEVWGQRMKYEILTWKRGWIGNIILSPDIISGPPEVNARDFHMPFRMEMCFSLAVFNCGCIGTVGDKLGLTVVFISPRMEGD